MIVANRSLTRESQADDAKDIDAVSKYPSQQLGGNPAPTQRQQHSSPSEDEIAKADLKWEPSVQLSEIPKAPVGGAQSFASITLRSCAVAAVIALVAWSVSGHRDYAPPAAAPAASPSVRNQQVKANEPTPSESALLTVPQPLPSQPSQVTSTQAGSAPLSGPAQGSAVLARPAGETVRNQQVKANEPTQSELALLTVPQPLPSQPSQVTSTQAGSAPLSPPAQGSTAPRRPPEEIALLLSRATDFFAQSDYASARPLLQRAAEAGSASAALMLAATFDPLVVHPIGGTGIKPDTALARQWYEKAVELGSEAASQQLAKLTQAGE